MEKMKTACHSNKALISIKIWKMKTVAFKTFSFAILLGLTSCIYSTKYVASYEVEPQITVKSTAEALNNIMGEVANEHALKEKKKKASKPETTVYKGKFCHKFKFKTEETVSSTILSLSYRGMFGKRSNPPYDTFLTSLNDSINASFTNVVTEISEISNRKPAE